MMIAALFCGEISPKYSPLGWGLLWSGSIGVIIAIVLLCTFPLFSGWGFWWRWGSILLFPLLVGASFWLIWHGVTLVRNNSKAGHSKANRIYAWSHDTGDPENPKRYVTVLHIPPVVSPQTAVQAAIVQEYKSLESKKEN
jgi:hypothetical protein